MSTKTQAYVEAIISNPEWIKMVAVKHNAVQTTDQGQIVCRLSSRQIAEAALDLEHQLRVLEVGGGN